MARLLTDFHSQEGRPVAAFDLNSGEHTLAQFLPERATAATIRDISGQMALFDRLIADEDTTKVIDLGHESFDPFFAVAHQIGFVEEARQRSVAVAILFIVTPDQTSVEAFRNLQTRFRQATLAPVHNELLGPAQHRDKYSLAGSGSVIVHLPVLAPGLRKYIDTPPFSFANSNMGNAVGIPLDGHLEVHRWLRRVYLEFRELDLRILLADLQSSIRLQS
ncbi:MAG TPA: hypothetical protein VIV34_10055 [Pseudolabrys sp.]